MFLQWKGLQIVHNKPQKTLLENETNRLLQLICTCKATMKSKKYKEILANELAFSHYDKFTYIGA